MFGLVLTFLFIIWSWLTDHSLAAATLAAFEFLLRWYILWSIIGGAYGLISIAIATLRAEGGFLSTLFMFLFSSLAVAAIWTIHYGALFWGTSLLIGLFTSFSGLALFGGVVLIGIGCLMQVIELIIINS